MAVPANPKLSDVCTEFQVAITTPLSAFRRNAGIVPDGAANANVPTTLPIRLQQLAGAVKNVYTPVGINGPTSASGLTELQAPGPTSTAVASNTVTMSGTGGTGSYSYSWSHVSGDASIAINGGGASVNFSATVSRNNFKQAVKRCTVSDGTTSASRDVTVTLTYSTFN